MDVYSFLPAVYQAAAQDLCPTGSGYTYHLLKNMCLNNPTEEKNLKIAIINVKMNAL